MRAAARQLIDRAVSAEPVRVLAVDGPAGSGKTTFAALLADELQRCTGQVPPVVHTDDLCEGWNGLPGVPGKLTSQVLEPLASGSAGRYRRWDWVGSRPGEEMVVPSADWVVVEGVGCGATPCRPHLSALAWLEADVATRRGRALQRDGEIFAPHWDAWAEAEKELFAANLTRSSATLVLRT